MIIKLRNDLIINFGDISGNEFSIIDNFQLKHHKISIPIELKQYIELLIKGVVYKDNLFLIDPNWSNNFDHNIMINIVFELDKFLLLDNQKSSNKLNEIINYTKLITRPNICEGILYSSNDTKFIEDLTEIMEKKSLNITITSNTEDFNLIFAPHLDYYANKYVTQAYANIFQYISKLNYDLVVYLGTAHFINSSLFMFCDKNYSTPLNNTLTDKELINEILDDCSKYLNYIRIKDNSINSLDINKIITIDNLAHKDEHSIELHNTFISFLNKGSNINILPILTGSFDNNLDPKIYNCIVDIIKNKIKSKYNKVLFLCSGDMSHIGVKFGDLSNFKIKETSINENNFDNLNSILSTYEYKKNHYISYEKDIINSFIVNNLSLYKDLMFEKNKDFRICGFAPFYSGLSLFPELKGNLIEHGYTENIQEEFLVSFITMIFS